MSTGIEPGGRNMTPQEMVERALALSEADDCIVIVDEGSTANLRFAGHGSNDLAAKQACLRDCRRPERFRLDRTPAD